jgi:hypothetical protein
MSEERQHCTATSADAAARAHYTATMHELAAMWRQADKHATVYGGLPIVPRWLMKWLHLA